jgi:F-type H+-transporting ATPase subunit b
MEIVFSLSTFLITVINIGILFFILRAILFKPVTQFMENRQKGIQEALDQAETEKNQAKLLLKQYEDQIKNIEKEASEILKTAREAAKIESDRIIAEGKAASELILANGHKQLEAERQAALAVFRAEAAALVITASSRLLQRELNQDDSRRQAAALLRDLGN